MGGSQPESLERYLAMFPGPGMRGDTHPTRKTSGSSPLGCKRGAPPETRPISGIENRPCLELNIMGDNHDAYGRAGLRDHNSCGALSVDMILKRVMKSGNALKNESVKYRGAMPAPVRLHCFHRRFGIE